MMIIQVIYSVDVEWNVEVSRCKMEKLFWVSIWREYVIVE